MYHSCVTPRSNIEQLAHTTFLGTYGEHCLAAFAVLALEGWLERRSATVGFAVLKGVCATHVLEVSAPQITIELPSCASGFQWASNECAKQGS